MAATAPKTSMCAVVCHAQLCSACSWLSDEGRRVCQGKGYPQEQILASFGTGLLTLASRRHIGFFGSVSFFDLEMAEMDALTDDVKAAALSEVFMGPDPSLVHQTRATFQHLA